MSTYNAGSPRDGVKNIADYYEVTRLIGNGAFGSVFEARDKRTREIVAIKKVLQDRRYRNREHQILRLLKHVNIVGLKDAHLIQGKKDLYLYLVMEYIPETISNVIVSYTRRNHRMPERIIKVYAYQLIRSLSYLRTIGICHRDIKPQNILVDPQSHIVKLCDFGSAKRLVPGEPNVAYICSRYYRAPELIYGAQTYTPAVDLWSAACVIAEMYLVRPLFAGANANDQLNEIIRILGPPTHEDILKMTPQPPLIVIPTIKRITLASLFPVDTPASLYDLLSKMLVYQPDARLTPLECLAHPYFDDLRQPNFSLPGCNIMPPLFDISSDELVTRPDLAEKLVPKHARESCPYFNSHISRAARMLSVDEHVSSEDGTSVISTDRHKPLPADVINDLAATM